MSITQLPTAMYYFCKFSARAHLLLPQCHQLTLTCNFRTNSLIKVNFKFTKYILHRETCFPSVLELQNCRPILLSFMSSYNQASFVTKPTAIPITIKSLTNSSKLNTSKKLILCKNTSTGFNKMTSHNKSPNFARRDRDFEDRR